MQAILILFFTRVYIDKKEPNQAEISICSFKCSFGICVCVCVCVCVCCLCSGIIKVHREEAAGQDEVLHSSGGEKKFNSQSTLVYLTLREV